MLLRSLGGILCSTSLWSLGSTGSYTLLCTSPLHYTCCTDCSLYAASLFSGTSSISSRCRVEGVSVVFRSLVRGKMKLCILLCPFPPSFRGLAPVTRTLDSAASSSQVCLVIWPWGVDDFVARVSLRILGQKVECATWARTSRLCVPRDNRHA